MTDTPSNVSVLDAAHAAAFQQTLTRILSSHVAEFTFSEILDGLPTEESYLDFHLRIAGHPVFELKHTSICPGVVQRIRKFREAFDPLTLSFSSSVSLPADLSTRRCWALLSHALTDVNRSCSPRFSTAIQAPGPSSFGSSSFWPSRVTKSLSTCTISTKVYISIASTKSGEMHPANPRLPAGIVITLPQRPSTTATIFSKNSTQMAWPISWDIGQRTKSLEASLYYLTEANQAQR